MNRVALDLGFIQIYWYSIFIFLGILVASIIILRPLRTKRAIAILAVLPTIWEPARLRLRM